MPFENNNENGKKTKKFLYGYLDKHRFYIILFLCVCIVAVTALWVSRQGGNDFIAENIDNMLENRDNRPDVTLVEDGSQKDLQEASRLNDTGKTENAQENNEASLNRIFKEERPKETKKPVAQNEKKQSEVGLIEKDGFLEKPAAAAGTSKIYAMALPVDGKIGLPFAADRLVYHKTLEHWSTHKGLDIQAEEGTPVRAALDGEVIEVVNDTIIGITITLLHEDGLITRYGNLATDAMVKKGDMVEKGQVISTVGKTASNKRLEGPLLHFQVIMDGKYVDPQLYLPEIE